MVTTQHTANSISLDRGHPSIRVLSTINDLIESFRGYPGGEVASYIPELARVDPNLFAIAVVTATGEVFSVGDARHKFTLQSLASPFTYGIALARLGAEHILQNVGSEPTGNPFHAIVLERGTNRPMNPLVNAGAIAIAAMMPGKDPTERLNNVLDDLSAFVGERPIVDMQVFMSEKTTADRNRSIAYLMRNFGRLEGDLDQALDLYFQMCSVSVDSVQLATMAATLANRGVNPLTGDEVQARANSRSRVLRDVLTVMFTCGLYEQSGYWTYRVGVPAKSGVSGGFMAVVPGVLGLAVFSPRVDATGTSVAGAKVAEQFVTRLGLHVFGGGATR